MITTNPSAGQQVARDSTVTLVVSQGPAPVPIPDVRGMPGPIAAAALTVAGFNVVGIEGPPLGLVLETDPPANEAHQKGTSVRLFTRR